IESIEILLNRCHLGLCLRNADTRLQTPDAQNSGKAPVIVCWVALSKRDIHVNWRRKTKRGGKNADDRIAHATELYGFTQHIEAAAVTGVPFPGADHRNRGPARLVFLRRKLTAQGRAHAQHLEKPGGDFIPRYMLGIARTGQVELIVSESGKCLKAARIALPIPKIRQR